MFDKVRKPGRGKTITAYVIFGAICLVFVFFGIAPQQMGFQQGGAAAVVNNSHLSQADFLQQVDSMQRQYSQQLEALPEAQRQAQMVELRARALEQLVDAELLYQSGVEEGLVATDAEVRDAIGGIPVFQENGKFRRDFYIQFLQNQGYSPGQFEQRIRKDIVVNKIRDLFLASFLPVKGEQEKTQMLADTKIELELVKFSQKSLQEALRVTDSEIKAFLSQPDNLEKAKAKYQSTVSQYSLPEEVRARHILLTKTENESEADLKAKVDQALKRLETEDFAVVAKEMSADTGSAQKGGDLGYFSRGRMVPEFENAAFSLEPGKVSAPIKSDFGFHIIKVEDKKLARTKAFEDVQVEIAKNLIVEPKIEETLNQIRAHVKEGNTKALETQLAQLNWNWEETGPFSLSSSFIPKMGSNDEILSHVAKNPQVGKLIPQLIESGGEYFIVKVEDLNIPTQVAATGDETSKFFAMRRAGDAFSTWLKNEKDDSRIKLNSKLIVNQ